MSPFGVSVLGMALMLTVFVQAVDKGNKAKGLMIGLEQKPIFYAGEFRNTDRELGEHCQFSFDCSSGCCLKESSGRRRCSRKAQKGELCSVSQVKLDLYMDHCPCEKGNQHCPNGPMSKCRA